MRWTWMRCLVGISSVLLVLADQAAGQKFVVEVTQPVQNATVGREMLVKGTASIPSGYYVWVLARRHDFAPLWWPQREAAVDPRTKEWQAIAAFGEPRDVGWEFDVGVIVVDAESHARLVAYWTRAMTTGDWTKPMQIPDVAAPPKLVKVRKVRH